MPSNVLWDRARRRCSGHLPAEGVCRKCLLAEMEEMILEGHPEMCRGDAFELVQEWVLVGEDAEH